MKAVQVKSNVKIFFFFFFAVRALFFRNSFPQAVKFTSINTGIFAASEVDSSPKTSRTMAKLGVVDAPWECTDAYSFSSAISGHWKRDCGIPPSLLAWLLSCDFLLPRMNSQLRGYQFHDIPDIQEPSLKVSSSGVFSSGRKVGLCINSDWDCSEGDKNR